jgi:prepilin-type N-terminal cleavage/methylation domain-containing protein/prepilin-type processing-associated H-X9-DG protein
MKRRAFTLIELIVVIGIIALLTAILVPILGYSRENAKAVLCGSNIKQLFFALSLYEGENGAFPYSFNIDIPYPPADGYAGSMIYDKAGWWWFNYITDYSIKDLSRDSIVWCPSRQVKDIRLQYNVLSGNYGVNQSICKSSYGSDNQTEFVGKPLSCTEISNPSMTLLVVDSGYSMVNWWHVTDNPPQSLGSRIEDRAFIPGLWINENKNIWRGLEDDAVYGRHPGKTVNIGFAGGNITRIKADNLFVEKTGDTYKNKSPLWVPK